MGSGMRNRSNTVVWKHLLYFILNKFSTICLTLFVTLPRLNCCTDCNEILHGNPLIVVVGHKLLFTVITYKHDCGVAVNS